MRLHLLQFDIYVLGPTIYDDVYSGARISQSLEHVQRAFGVTNAGNVERHYQQDFISHIQGRDRYRIKRVGQIKYDAFISLAQHVKDLGNVLRLDPLCFMRFEWRRE